MLAGAAVVTSRKNQIVDPMHSVEAKLAVPKAVCMWKSFGLCHIYTIVSVVRNLLGPHGEDQGEAWSVAYWEGVNLVAYVASPLM